MKLPRHPSYKASGVEWLGDVPEHWTVERSDMRVTTTKRQVAPSDFSGLEVFHYSIPVVQEQGTGAVEDGETIASAKQVIDAPMVLVSRLNPRKATICRAAPHGSLLTLASTEFVALQPTKGDIRFLEYLATSELFRQRLDSWVQSVTRSHQRARPEEIYRFWSAWPDPVEQRTIADFLDRETARIDALIAKKRTLIERLQEKRTALISRAVTRGLPPAAASAAGFDPNPKLKPSGIDWLGDVPERWKVATVRRHRLRIQAGSTPPTNEALYYEDGDVPWFGPGSFDRPLDVGAPVKLISALACRDGVARIFRRGATLIVTIGATLGKVAYLTQSGSCNQQVTAIEFDPQSVHDRYATYLLRHLEPCIRGIAPSATLPILDQGEVADLPLVLPSLEEQLAIAAFLDHSTQGMEAVGGGIHTAIERLSEYRTALITAAVTGKIDVRSLPTRPGASEQFQVRTPEGARAWR